MSGSSDGDKPVFSSLEEERYRGKAVPKDVVDTRDGFPSYGKKNEVVMLPPLYDGRIHRVLNFISHERKLLFSEVQDHAARMEAEAISELMKDLIILNRLEDEARGLSDS